MNTKKKTPKKKVTKKEIDCAFEKVITDLVNENKLLKRVTLNWEWTQAQKDVLYKNAKEEIEAINIHRKVAVAQNTLLIENTNKIPNWIRKIFGAL